MIVSGLFHNSFQYFVILLTGRHATSGPTKILVLSSNRRSSSHTLTLKISLLQPQLEALQIGDLLKLNKL